MSTQTATDINPNVPKTTKPSESTKSSARAVDISISGTPHRIVCPVDEVQNLENAAKFINEKIREIRHSIKGKNPNNEELLVLTCLELYDQVQNLREDKQHQVINNERARTLIDKMIKDARSVL